MARSPNLQRPPMVRPTYKVVRDLRGGINTSQPPDQIADNEASAASNVTYMNGVLCVDFGVVLVGSPLFGVPQQSILWVDDANVSHSLVVTTKTLYLWDSSLQDWLPVSGVASNTAVTNSTTTGAGSNPSVSFTGAATWTTGNNVAAKMDNGLYLVGTADGTTSPVTIATPLPVDRSIPSGNAILAIPTFTALDDVLPVSYAEDPFRNLMFITNGTDPVQIYDGTYCRAEPNLVSAGITTARYVCRFNYIMCLASVTDGGKLYTYRIRRSATSDSSNWTTLNAGFDDLIDTGDEITGLYVLNQNLAIPRRQSLMVAQYYGVGQQVFWYSYALTGIGSIGLSANVITKFSSIVVDDSGLYFFSGTPNVQDVGEKIFNAILSYTGDLVPGSIDRLHCYYNSVLDESWILYQAGVQTAPGSMWKYSHRHKCWHRRDFVSPLSFSSIGDFVAGQPAQEWNTWLGNWLTDNLAWNSAAGQPAFRTILLTGDDANDTSVYQYNYLATTDNGVAIPWSYTSKDFPIPDEVEMLDGLVFYGQGTIGLVEVSLDGGNSYLSWATNVAMSSLWTRAEVDGQVASGFYRIRLSGTDPGFKLSWWAAKMIPASER